MMRLMHYAQPPRKCLLHSSSAYADCMATAGERLKQARVKAGYSSAAQAAEAMGANAATYAQHENGLRGYPASKAERYGRFFRVAPEWLLYGRQKDEADTVALGPRLFVKGEVAAGVWKEAWEFEADEWEVFTGRADVGAPLQKRFGLRVSGESMNEIYPIGSIVECVQYDHGEIISSGPASRSSARANRRHARNDCEGADPDGRRHSLAAAPIYQPVLSTVPRRRAGYAGHRSRRNHRYRSGVLPARIREDG